MRVIIRGVPPQEKRYSCTCSNCRSVLEYTGEDILKKTLDQRDDDTHYLGACPVCNAALYDYVPKEVKTEYSTWKDL